MQPWKRAVLAGSAAAAVIMFLQGKRSAGLIPAGVALALLASEYPEKFAHFRRRLPDYVERGVAFLDVASRVGERLAEAAESRGSAWHEVLLDR